MRGPVSAESPCVAEGWIDFAAEVSVVVARGFDGHAVCYPVALNHHERHILDTTLMPAPVGPIVAQEARGLALAVAQALGTVGVLTVEFFLTAGRQAPGQRNRPPPPQLGTPHDRSGRHQPVRAAGPGIVRVASGPGRPADPGGDGQFARRLVGRGRRRAALGCRFGARSGRQTSPLRQADASRGPKNGPPDRPRSRSGDRAPPRLGSAACPRRQPSRLLMLSDNTPEIARRCSSCILLNPVGSGSWS